MEVTIQSLIAVALNLCPWVPEEMPHMEILPPLAYEEKARKYGALNTVGMMLRWPDRAEVYLKQGYATDRLLCHEWRHIVEPEWDCKHGNLGLDLRRDP